MVMKYNMKITRESLLMAQTESNERNLPRDHLKSLL